jgi:thiol-disulfide isomerase/thioredoxin
MRKLLLGALALLAVVTIAMVPTKAVRETNLYFFYSQGCLTCAAEEVYLDELEASDENLVIHRYEIAFDKENQAMVKEIEKVLGIRIRSTPTLLVGRKTIVGFTKGNTENDIEAAIKYFRDNNVRDVVGELLGIVEPGQGVDIDPDNAIITLPFFGEINAKTVSVPLLGIVLGALDGFNPCAMWVLLLLISMLFHLEESWKKWFLGGLFLATSGIMYFMFMLAWLNVTLLFGTISYIRLLIAAIALIGGIANIRKYIITPPGCEVVDDRQRKKIAQRVKQIFNQPVFVLASIGVVVLAISVNLVELICSAGLPVIYTQVLSLQNLSGVEYILYLLLYLFFFMLDDVIIFVIAMKTAQLSGISTKYSRWAHLIGGILMIVLGLLMALKPEWLMLKF